jgi:hypothetical protein
MDMSVCVGAQPIGWYWNIGKLCALIAPTLGDCIEQRYPDDEFKGVITTSLWGKSSQYNRIYKYLGKTKGYGHEHISEERYQSMLQEMRQAGVDIPSSSFGAGSNPRMRRIRAYAKAFPKEWEAEFGSTPAARMNHGKRRGIYYHPAVDPARGSRSSSTGTSAGVDQGTSARRTRPPRISLVSKLRRRKTRRPRKELVPPAGHDSLTGNRPPALS